MLFNKYGKVQDASIKKSMIDMVSRVASPRLSVFITCTGLPLLVPFSRLQSFRFPTFLLTFSSPRGDSIAAGNATPERLRIRLLFNQHGGRCGSGGVRSPLGGHHCGRCELQVLHFAQPHEVFASPEQLE